MLQVIGLQWGGNMLDGSLTLDPCTLRMTIRKGDTGNVCFALNEVLSDCTFWFVVKEDIDQLDEEAPIFQEYEFAGGSYLLIKISEEESNKLDSGSNTCLCKRYKDYIWGIKYAEHERDENGNYVGLGSIETLVPRLTKRPPVFRVYPEIIGKTE